LKVLKAGQQLLQIRGVETARLESELMMAHVLGVPRHQLYLKEMPPLNEGQKKVFDEMLERRIKGEPLQYILGAWEFMGLKFYVDQRVLIPRPETELLVEIIIRKVKSLKESTAVDILDLGTGSGAIAVSLACYLENAGITAVDIQEDALQVAEKNAAANGVFHKITFLHGDMFSPLDQFDEKKMYDIIVSNPPYIPTPAIQELMTEVREFEPRTALDGGADGLYHYRIIAGSAWRYMKKDGIIAMEFGENQAKKIQDLFLKTGVYENPEIYQDLRGMDRIAIFKKRQGVFA
jgi:release factor glutamine methyltransferase